MKPMIAPRDSVMTSDHGPRRLCVALVTETFAPEVNGVAMTLGRLVDGLRGFGHRVQIVRPRQAIAADRGARHADLVLRPGVQLPGYAGLQLGLPCGPSLRAEWRRMRPDVVHVATEGPLGVSALRAASRLGIPVTSTYHTNFDQYSSHYGMPGVTNLVGGWLRRFHNRTHVTLVPTANQAAALRADGYRHVDVLGRGVDAQRFHPGQRDPDLRRRWGLGDDDLAVLYLGRLAAEKNLATSIAAFDAIRAVRPDATMIVVGDGPERAQYANYPGVHFAGMQRGDDLARHVASCDLFPFASTTETYGNVVTEAMACGVAVVAFNYAAASERIQSGRDGVLVAFGENDRLVAEAAALAADRRRLASLRTAAPAAVANCTWTAMTAVFERHLVAACQP